MINYPSSGSTIYMQRSLRKACLKGQGGLSETIIHNRRIEVLSKISLERKKFRDTLSQHDVANDLELASHESLHGVKLFIDNGKPCFTGHS